MQTVLFGGQARFLLDKLVEIRTGREAACFHDLQDAERGVHHQPGDMLHAFPGNVPVQGLACLLTEETGQIGRVVSGHVRDLGQGHVLVQMGLDIAFHKMDRCHGDLVFDIGDDFYAGVEALLFKIPGPGLILDGKLVKAFNGIAVAEGAFRLRRGGVYGLDALHDPHQPCPGKGRAFSVHGYHENGRAVGGACAANACDPSAKIPFQRFLQDAGPGGGPVRCLQQQKHQGKALLLKAEQ